MIADVGLAALWGAAMLALVELLLSLRPAEPNSAKFRAVRVGLTIVALVAFALLVTDFSAAWSGLAGQCLLWSALFGVATLIQAYVGRDTEALFARKMALLEAMLSGASLLILLFLLFPFAPMASTPASELPASLALVLGDVGLASAATIGIGAIWAKAFSRPTARTMRGWTLAAWIALTIANLVVAEPIGAPRLLIPWLAATVLLHALALVASRGRLRRLPLPLWPGYAPALAVAVLALVISVLAAPTVGLIGRIMIVLGTALIPASLTPLFLRPLRRLSPASVGIALAHLGFALALIGASWSASFREQRSLVMHPGETAAIGPWMVHLVELLPAAGPDFTALEAHLEASRGEGLMPLLPQSRYVGPQARSPIRGDATIDQLPGALSASLDGIRASEAVSLTFVWRPLRSLVWIGGLVMAAGGLLTLIGRGFAASRRRREADDVYSARGWR